jgi:hypothetical protein
MRILSDVVTKLSAAVLFVLLLVPMLLFQVGTTIGNPRAMAGSVFAILVWLAWHAGMIGRLSDIQRRPIPKMYFALVGIAIVYVVSILVIAITSASRGDTGLLALTKSLQDYTFIWLPVHMAAIAGLVYSAWLAARRLVDAELGTNSTWDRTIGSWLLIWFFPIGVWFVQSRFKRVAHVA